MKIIGFNFKKISAEKSKDPTGKVQIKSDLNIEKIEKQTIPLFKKQKGYSFDFTYIISYTPKIAEVKFQGVIVAVFEKKETKDILKDWKKKKLKDDLRIPIFNFIMTKSNLKALQLEDDLNLPTHVPFPKLVPPGKKDNRNYVR